VGTSERLLNKTGYRNGMFCPKRLWLDFNRRDLRAPLTAAAKERIAVGGEVELLARKRYPGGHLVPNTYGDYAEAAEKTRQLIRDGAECLFEATVMSEGKLARTDVLWRSTAGWVIDEVKSSTMKDPKELAKTDKAQDLAFQRLIAMESGLSIQACRLIMIDSSYVWQLDSNTAPHAVSKPVQPGLPNLFDESPSYDVEKMLGAVDMTLPCTAMQTEVDRSARRLQQIIASTDEPVVQMNTHCKECDYLDYCKRNRPKHDLLYLPRIKKEEVAKLHEAGIEAIEQIPSDHKLTAHQQRVRQVVLTKKPYIDESLGDRIAAIPFPAAFIDYESSSPALPYFPGTRPYQQVCFQWSSHIMSSPDADPVHTEFLGELGGDPRIEFCRSLWQTVAKCASIIHYTGFEITQLKAMAKDGIPYARELLGAIQEKTVDLHRIVSECVYFEEFRGSTSIKKVLPVLVPAMTYEDMAISDGLAAAAGYRELLNPATPAKDKEKLREDLLAYCKQDTLAMVEIYNALRKLARAA
jgi:hypothetical protein